MVDVSLSEYVVDVSLISEYVIDVNPSIGVVNGTTIELVFNVRLSESEVM